MDWIFDEYDAVCAQLMEEGCRLHHESSCRGYVSRRHDGCKVQDYEGRFGEGYKLLRPRYDSTQYCWVEYWIRED